MDARQRWGDVVRFRGLPGLLLHTVFHPDDVDRVLRSHVANYPKGYFNQRLGLLVGQGILVNEGAAWRQQRRLLQPAFHKDRLVGLGHTISAATMRLLGRWEQQMHHDAPFDLALDMQHLTLEIVGRALLDIDVADERGEVGAALALAIGYINYHVLHPLAPPAWLPTSRNRAFRRASKLLDERVFAIIAERQRRGVAGDDLLGMLLDARDEATSASMSAQQLRDEVVTMILAGHDAPGLALSWAWYLLAQHPDVEQHLHAELDNVLGGRSPTVGDLPQLHFTKMVIDETLRLYPSLWAMGRQATETDELGGYHIPARSLVVVSPYVTHRNPEYWDNPMQFDPERWLPSRMVDRPFFAYFPFGGGARHCMGNHFAMMEMQLILATVAQRFCIRLVAGQDVEAAPIGTLRPRNGIWVRVEGREG